MRNTEKWFVLWNNQIALTLLHKNHIEDATIIPQKIKSTKVTHKISSKMSRGPRPITRPKQTDVNERNIDTELNFTHNQKAPSNLKLETLDHLEHIDSLSVFGSESFDTPLGGWQ